MEYVQQGTANMPQELQRMMAAQQSQGNAAKSPSISEQLNHQEQALAKAHAMIDALVDRLQVVLGPVPPTTCQIQNAAPTPQSPQFSQRIPMHTRGIEAISSRIAELMQRVEL